MKNLGFHIQFWVHSNLLPIFRFFFIFFVSDGVSWITFLRNDNRSLEEVSESLEKDGLNELFN